jgi:hypothetical protein
MDAIALWLALAASGTVTVEAALRARGQFLKVAGELV